MPEDAFDKSALLAATQAIVAAHLGNNQVPTAEVPGFIKAVMLALTGGVGVEEEEAPAKPAVPVSRSVTQEKIFCLECGASYKSLKRHLRTHHNLSPKEYRQKWRLSETYPMVAPAYAKARSELAHKSGLGHAKKPIAQAAE